MIGIGIDSLVCIGRNSLSAAVAALFASSEQGAWYDPSDLTTLFQDSVGSIPVTAVEQPVGLMLDKRLGLVLGSELVTNGTFDTDTTGWSAALNSTISVVSGRLRVTATASPSIAQCSFATVVGCAYRIRADYTAGTAGTPMFRAGSSSLGVNYFGLIGAGVTASIDRVFVATGTTAYIGAGTSLASAGQYADFDNVSVKELPGNHATQATAGNRPVLRVDGNNKHYLAFNGTSSAMSSPTGGGGAAGFFLCQVVKPTGGAGAIRALWSDAGTNTGYRVRINASNQLELSAGNGTAYTSIATVATLPVGETHLITAWDDGVNLKVQIDAGAIATVARPTVSAGTTGFVIGTNSGTAANWFTGNLYPEVYRQIAPNAAQIASVQAYCKSKAGL